jgi:ParB/RepB/Spo0J family partition protein
MNQTNTAIETQWVPLSAIDVPSYGRVHSPDSLKDLAQDMSKNGQLQNIIVSKEGDRFQLIVGKGRLEAARQLGWEKVRADVKEGLTTMQKLTLINSENSEREGVSPFYTAMVFKLIMDAGSLTQDELAAQMGKDQSFVSRYMTLAKVPAEVWQEQQSGLTSMRQCLEIAKADNPEDQKKLVDACVKEGLDAPAIKKRAKSLKGDQPKEPAQAAADSPKGPFGFTWKGNTLVIKGRPFTPHAESIGQYLQALEAAYDAFMAEEKARQTSGEARHEVAAHTVPAAA